MSTVTAQMIKELRDRTGVGMTKCKEALVEVSGDIEKAIELLRKSGAASAVKKQSRETNEGAVRYYEEGNLIVLLEMNAETDFVVNNERFQELHKEMLKEAAKSRPNNVEEFLAAPYSQNDSKTIDEKRREMIAVLGENIQISKILVVQKKPDHSYGLYSHLNGKIGVFVELEGASGQETLARDIAMHVAAEAPEYLKAEEVPANIKAQEEDIAKSGVPSNKPADIIEKIVAGKMRAFYDSVCLLNQKYIKDPSVSIATLVENKAKELDTKLQITRFVRWQIGE